MDRVLSIQKAYVALGLKSLL